MTRENYVCNFLKENNLLNDHPSTANNYYINLKSLTNVYRMLNEKISFKNLPKMTSVLTESRTYDFYIASLTR